MEAQALTQWLHFMQEKVFRAKNRLPTRSGSYTTDTYHRYRSYPGVHATDEPSISSQIDISEAYVGEQFSKAEKRL